MNAQRKKIRACVLLREAIQENDPEKKSRALALLAVFYPNMEEYELVKSALGFLAAELCNS